ncbi:Coiled-coil domain-containing protein 61 [Chytriomyces hyalinus]|nr:Coiled-coil domain-containing protein 61 [Chytriomyces hyalinus]
MISSTQQIKLRGLSFDIRLQITPGESLSIELDAAHLSGAVKRWSGCFSSQYIEQVTKKTGNFKRFTVFCEMISAASSNNNQASLSGQANVSLDLISAADLAPESPADTSLVDCDKLYLVLTYAVAFDRVHYPLPLQKVDAQQRQPAIYIPPQNSGNHQSSRASLPPVERSINPDNQLRTLEETVRVCEMEIHSLKLEKEHHLRELAHLMRENDKLRYATKHSESTNQETSRRNNATNNILVSEMPELFKTLFKGITGNPSHSDTFKKSVKALQRLVGKLLDVSSPTRVQSTASHPNFIVPILIIKIRMHKTDAIFESTREKNIRSKQHSSTQRDGSRQKSTSKPTPQRSIPSKRHEPNAASPAYKPLKSRPLGASYGSSDHLQYNNSTRKKPAAKESPSRVSNSSSRNSSVTSAHRRFDPTSYILEKELKLLAKREASQESLRSRQRSASFPRETVFSNVGVTGSGSVRSSAGGYSSRNSSLAKPNLYDENAKSGASRERTQTKRYTKPKNGTKKYHTDANTHNTAQSYKARGARELDKQREEDIDKRLEFLQQYLTTLNQ